MNEIINGKKKSEILAEHISKMNYDDIIYHNEIEMIISEKYGTSKYNSEISRAKRIMLDKYHRAIESIRGDGYRVVNADNFVRNSLRHYKRGFKAFNRGYNSLTHAPVNDMSADGKDEYKRVMDRCVLINASMKGVQAELKALSRRNPLAPELVQAK